MSSNRAIVVYVTGATGLEPYILPEKEYAPLMEWIAERAITPMSSESEADFVDYGG